MTLLSFNTAHGIASGRVTRATVHLDRVMQNVRSVQDAVGPEVGVLGVIKADGYGHGAIPVARAMIAAGASWLGVACVDEGLALRTAGIESPILVMGYADAGELQPAVDGDLTLTLGTAAQCSSLAAAAHGLSDTLRVHLKIDTGMGRFGVLPEQIDTVARTLRAAPHIEVDGCLTHLARGEDPPEVATDDQLNRFTEAMHSLRRFGIEPRLVHAANSGATLAAPASRFNLVRAGLLLYGYAPVPGIAGSVNLKPALEIQSRLVRVETLAAGTRIGYGHTHVLSRPSRVGLVPIGYADGLQRSLSDVGYLVVSGRRVPIIGRISMDQCSIDLTDVDGAVEGDDVWVIGADYPASVWADDLAAWAGTVVYEILCGISPRVPRAYLGGKL